MRRSLIREKLARDEFITIAQSWIIPHWKLVDLMGSASAPRVSSVGTSGPTR